MKTKEERLKFYKRMLRDYRLSRYIPFIKYCLNTHGGLCHYMWSKDKMLRMENFPELMAQKPPYPQPYLFWFPSRELKPRIYCLENAIKLCENDTE